MPEWFEDPAERLEALALSVEPKFRARFLAVVKSIKDSMTLENIARLIEDGQIDEALVTAEIAALQMSSLWTQVFILSGSETAKVIQDSINIIVEFDHLNRGALDAMTQNKLRLVEGFVAEQRAATMEALLDGIEQGLNPLQMATAFKDSIGLTQYQQQIIINYRKQLEALDPSLFDRALRDKRFDRAVRNAIESGKALTPEQIDRMVQRYTEKWIKYRAEVIAKTEALRSVHAGNYEMYRQAVERGDLDPNELIRTWDTSKLPNVRDSHRAMEGQKRPLDQPFLSGLGNLLMVPGDINAPAADTVECKCSVTTRFTNAAKEAASAALATTPT